MATKNINPYSGLKEIISGFFYVPRIKIVDLVRKYGLKPLEIGYYLILLTSVDWHEDKYRKGYIRIDLENLAKIWKVPVTTFRENINRLINRGLIVVGEKNLPIFVDFDSHTFPNYSPIAKTKYSDEFLHKYFENLELENEIPSSLKPNITNSFKTSFKEESRNDLDTNNVKNNKKSYVRSDAEYQKMYDENPDSLTVEEMKSIDIDLENFS